MVITTIYELMLEICTTLTCIKENYNLLGSRGMDQASKHLITLITHFQNIKIMCFPRYQS
jgi:hypothetical protein